MDNTPSIEELRKHYDEIIVDEINDNFVVVNLFNSKKVCDRFTKIIFENYDAIGRVFIDGDMGSCTLKFYDNSLKAFNSKDYKPNYEYWCKKIVSFDKNLTYMVYDIEKSKKAFNDFFNEAMDGLDIESNEYKSLEYNHKEVLGILEEHKDDDCRNYAIYSELNNLNISNNVNLTEMVYTRYSYEAQYLCVCAMLAANEVLGCV